MAAKPASARTTTVPKTITRVRIMHVYSRISAHSSSPCLDLRRLLSARSSHPGNSYIRKPAPPRAVFLPFRIPGSGGSLPGKIPQATLSCTLRIVASRPLRLHFKQTLSQGASPGRVSGRIRRVPGCLAMMTLLAGVRPAWRATRRAWPGNVALRRKGIIYDRG